jgi:putative hydrolase of the HAD superfamily
MVTAIIFDWGGVFTSNASLGQFCTAYAAKHGIAAAPFTEKLLAIWHEARVGAVDSRIFWKELSELAGVPEEEFHRDIDDFLGYNPAMLTFVQERLYGKYKLGIISNHIESWFAPHIQEKALEGIFDAVITSYTSKSAKPDLKIYQDALQGLQVPAEQCVFIDDLEKNLPPARALGMQTILFKNLEQLKIELSKHGVQWS